VAIRELPGSSAGDQSPYHDPANQEREDQIRDAILLVRRLIQDFAGLHQEITTRAGDHHQLETWLLNNMEKPVIAGAGAVIFDPLICSTWGYYREACGLEDGDSYVHWEQQDKPAS